MSYRDLYPVLDCEMVLEVESTNDLLRVLLFHTESFFVTKPLLDIFVASINRMILLPLLVILWERGQAGVR